MSPVKRRIFFKIKPGLASRCAFVRQAANLWQYKALLQQRLAAQLGAFNDSVHLVDGLPIPLCGFSRAPSCRSFKGIAAYGYCAAKQQTYYGFHGHLLISATGVITGFSLTPANGNEREALWDMVQTIQGLLIGDKGYLSAALNTNSNGSALNSKLPCAPICKTCVTLLGLPYSNDCDG
jgi:hypothetical protein